MLIAQKANIDECNGNVFIQIFALAFLKVVLKPDL